MTPQSTDPTRDAPTTVEVSTGDFAWQVEEQSHHRLVVVDFWAPWCGPCRMLGPLLESLAAEDRGRWLLAKVNTDQHADLAARYGVQGIPDVKAFRDGKVVDGFVGALPRPQLREWLDGLLPSAADEVARRGDLALAQHELDAAARAYDAALALDTDHGPAVVGLARVALACGDTAGARAWLAKLSVRAAGKVEAPLRALQLQLQAAEAGPAEALRDRLAADPGDLTARSALAQQDAAAGRWAEAFAGWLEVVRSDRGAARELARKASVEGFALCTDAALVRSARSALSRELFC